MKENENKKEFTEAELEWIAIEDDVITASGFNGELDDWGEAPAANGEVTKEGGDVYVS